MIPNIATMASPGIGFGSPRNMPVADISAAVPNIQRRVRVAPPSIGWHVRSHAVAVNASSSTYAAIATRFFSTMRLLKSAIAMTVRLKALMKATMMRSAPYCSGAGIRCGTGLDIDVGACGDAANCGDATGDGEATDCCESVAGSGAAAGVKLTVCCASAARCAISMPATGSGPAVCVTESAGPIRQAAPASIVKTATLTASDMYLGSTGRSHSSISDTDRAKAAYRDHAHNG